MLPTLFVSQYVLCASEEADGRRSCSPSLIPCHESHLTRPSRPGVWFAVLFPQSEGICGIARQRRQHDRGNRAHRGGQAVRQHPRRWKLLSFRDHDGSVARSMLPRRKGDAATRCRPLGSSGRTGEGRHLLGKAPIAITGNVQMYLALVM